MVINKFLNELVIETPVYDTVYDDLFYNYYEVIVVYINDGSKVIEIMMDDILELLDLEYDRFI